MAIDLFGDRDLGAVRAEHMPAARYPACLPTLAREFPAAPAVYTGALENHPEVIERFAEARPVWGNPPEVLRRVRDPFLLRWALGRLGLPCPRCLPGDAAPPGSERWLVKPLRGAGGSGIEAYVARSNHRARGGDRPRGDASSTFLQEWIQGPSGAAVFIASQRAAHFLGATWQIVGDPAFGAGGYRYSGSLGPLHLPRGAQDVLQRVGNLLAAEFGLLGVFGVDFVLRRGLPFLVEVNPRYTASVEILELTLGVAALRGHAAAFAGPARDAAEACSRRAGPRRRGWLGKAILFARKEVRVPERFPCAGPLSTAPLTTAIRSAALWTVPRLADIPRAGERIARGRPIVTLFASGSSAEACRFELSRNAAEVYRTLEKPARRSRRRTPSSGIGR